MKRDTPADADDSEPVAEATEAAAEAEPVDEDVTQLPTKGRASFFVLLTCGFLACLCCVGGTVAASALGWYRSQNLKLALDEVGAPEGWKFEDSTVTPWYAEATLSGTDEPEPIVAWLDGLDEDFAKDELSNCASSEPQAFEFTVGGFATAVEVGPDDSGYGNCYATIQIDRS
ncbi:MAG: hypothetical protein ACRD0P_09530 [Stackebrandtia sp.]